jgi:hypothetical protein
VLCAAEDVSEVSAHNLNSESVPMKTALQRLFYRRALHTQNNKVIRQGNDFRRKLMKWIRSLRRSMKLTTQFTRILSLIASYTFELHKSKTAKKRRSPSKLPVTNTTSASDSLDDPSQDVDEKKQFRSRLRNGVCSANKIDRKLLTDLARLPDSLF